MSYMSVFDKLKFWKKDEFRGPELGFGGMEPGLGAPPMGMEGGFDMDQPMYGSPQQKSAQNYPQQQGFQQPEYEPPVVRTFDHTKATFQYPTSSPPVQDVAPQQYAVDKNLEVISVKLDALRAAIESVNQRLANVERLVQDQRRRGGW